MAFFIGKTADQVRSDVVTPGHCGLDPQSHTTYMAFLMSETADQVRSDVVAGIHGFFHW